MRSLFILIICFLIISCISNNNGLLNQERKYRFNELTVNFVKDTRVTTFIKKGKPISGIVIQKLDNGGKNIWNVENGLATKQTEYYPNGQMMRMLEMKNGVENGTFIMFFSTGKKHIEQFYEEGEKVGTWHRWNKDELVETIEY